MVLVRLTSATFEKNDHNGAMVYRCLTPVRKRYSEEKVEYFPLSGEIPPPRGSLSLRSQGPPMLVLDAEASTET